MRLRTLVGAARPVASDRHTSAGDPAPASCRRRMLGCVFGSVLAAAGTALMGRAAPAALATRKKALVIGNARYRASPLKNPVADAQAVAASLKSVGFEVELRENVTLGQLVESLREFTLGAGDTDVRVIFYAGHGVQARGRNYLLPVDTEPQSEDEIPGQGADIGEFVDRLGEIRRGINVVILDACRVNPFA